MPNIITYYFMERANQKICCAAVNYGTTCTMGKSPTSSNRRKVFLFIALAIFGVERSYAQDGCETVFSSNSAPSSEFEPYISGSLAGPLGTSNDSVVTAVGFHDGKVFFEKDVDTPWVSRHYAVENTLTQEGDVRMPVFLLGTRLAERFGYKITNMGNQKLEIQVPDSNTIRSVVTHLNQSLRARALEPITYLPVRTGFISIEEVQKIMLSADGDFRIYFPYADQNLQIASHEASFHLGSILLTQKITGRARAITEETQRFIDLLQSNRSTFMNKGNELKDQLLIERNFEMDAGLASMVTTPAFMRRDGQMKSYAKLFPGMTPRYRKYFLRNIEYLNRPSLQPYEAVLARLQLMTGLEVTPFLKHRDYHFLAHSLPDYRIGNQIRLDDRELEALKQLVSQYVAIPRAIYITGVAEDWLNEYLGQLDQRIEDLEKSFSQSAS